MRVVQATFGTFHHFDLARELLSRGLLQTIYSTFPWRRLEREGVPRKYVETFPWVHTPQFLLGRYGWMPEQALSAMGYVNAVWFDHWLRARIPECDALVGLSGAGLLTGAKVQASGGKFLCDRGSTHRAFQRRVLAEEYGRWGFRHDPYEARDMVRELRIYAQADAIVVPSQVARRSFLQEGVDGAKVFAIPYGVRLERFSKTADPPAERFEVIFAGGVSLRKGVPYLLEAFARLRVRKKRLRVVGAMSREMAELLPRLPKADVEIVGTVPQPELAAMLSASHVLVLPSIEEGLALVQGQALACGCPVIATAATGAEDLFTSGVEGMIVPEPDVTELARCMQELADDPALQQRMSEAALRRVQEIGGWSRYGDRWVEVLRQVTGLT